MTVSRGVGPYIVSIISIVIIVVVVLIMVNLLGSTAPVKPIISKSIELRLATEQVNKARLISELDELIAQSDSDEIREQWDRMTGCLPTKCPDEAYLDLTLVTVSVYETDIPESPLLINILAVNKYWGDPDRLLEFSRAMSLTSDQVEFAKNKNARKIWQQIVTCDNTCPEKNDLFFNLIKTVVQ